MPLLAVNAHLGQPILNQPIAGEGDDLADALDQATQAAQPGAPIVVMIHGYKFSPYSDSATPHRHIFSLKPRAGCWKAISWPRHLGFGKGRPEGICIGFGWEARGTIWQAWRSAQKAGAALAELVMQLRARGGGPVQIVAHSLGARVALAAMRQLPAGSLGRVILLAGAEYQSTAATALSTPAGQTAEVLNITSAENRLFDRTLELLVSAPLPREKALGDGLWTSAPNWLDIRVDDPPTRLALYRLGHRIPAPKRSICHWWAYLRPGLMLFYRDLIRRPESLSLARLKAELPARRATSPSTSPLKGLARIFPKEIRAQTSAR